MYKIITVSLAFIIASMSTFAQSLEDDKTIVYMKANVLFDSGRYDEAIHLYNRVLNEDRNYTQAYYMRAKSKFMLGAYKGTKKDALRFIELAGVNKNIVKLMGETEIKLENFTAARNYLVTSLELDPYDANQYKLLGDIHMALNSKNEACEQWTTAAKLGHSIAQQFLSEYCDIYLKEVIEVEKSDENAEEVKDSTDLMTDSVFEEDGIDRNKINKIEVDETLILVIGNGLGNRTLEFVPDIFMMSDRSGQVVINVCVDGTGKVLTAEFDNRKSNINKPGLTSLALRKSKEFQFFPSFRQEQCGYIIFDIK